MVFSYATTYCKIGRDCVHEELEEPPRQAVFSNMPIGSLVSLMSFLL